MLDSVRKSVCVALTTCLLATSGLIRAQSPDAAPRVTDQGATGLAPGQGVVRMQEMMRSIESGRIDLMDERTQQAMRTAQQSAQRIADPANLDEQTILSTINLAGNWQQMARKAYVDALPPRDRARGAAVLLGDGTDPEFEGKLYVFVSRSMPMALLRAYALEAMYTGATLVVKGLRRGDTLKDFVLESLRDFNSAEGQVLASLEINPNLFDMFQVEVVPTVVWSNRIGLEEVGSGCVAPPAAQQSYVTVTGPQRQPMEVEKPTCLPAEESSYYKIGGALKMDYVIERFEQAGAPKAAMNQYRARLAQRHANVHSPGAQPVPGTALAPIADDVTLDMLPRHVLLDWQDSLQKLNVQRGPYGPAFGEDLEDDRFYREELEKKIRHGLGVQVLSERPGY